MWRVTYLVAVVSYNLVIAFGKRQLEQIGMDEWAQLHR